MFPYEKLEVYKKAFEINSFVYRLLKRKKEIIPYVKNQLGRAAFSIMLNIAEGSGRYSKKDRRNFFVTARSSAFECAAAANFLFAEGEITEEERSTMYNTFEEISRMLFTMIRNLEKEE